ncbi:MAG: hypothetical protein ACLRR3_02275 [Eubacterium sp.]
MAALLLLFLHMDGKANVIVMADEDAISKGAHAGNMIKEIAKLCWRWRRWPSKYGSSRW